MKTQKMLLPLAISLSLSAYAQDSEELKTVVVETDSLQTAAFEAAKGQTVVNEEEIKMAQPLTLLESIDSVAGVNIENSQRPMTGDISIRGFTNERINLSVDNMDVTQFADGTSSVSRITALTVDPSLVKSFVVDKGGEGVDFGSGAIGGAITVETKTAKDYLSDGKTAGATVHTSGDSANHGGKLGLTAYGLWNDLDILGHVSKAHYGDVDTGKDEDIDNSSDSIDSRLKIGWESGNISIGSVTAYNSTEVGKIPYSAAYADSPYAEEEQVKRFQQGFNIGVNNGDWLNLTSNISYQNLKHDKAQRGSLILRNGSLYDLNYDDNFKDTKLSFDIANTMNHSLGSNTGELTAKLAYDRTTFDQKEFDYSDNTPVDYYGDSKGNNIALSLKEKINFGEKVTTDFGARYDHYKRSSSNYSSEYGDNKDSELSFNAGISVFPAEWLMVYGRYNEGYRAPNLRELYKKAEWSCHWPRKFCYNEPQPNLKPETSKNIEVGFGFNFDNTAFADRFTLKASVYRNNIDNYIATAPFMYRIVNGEKVFASPEEATHRDYSTKNIDKMKTRGAELEIFYQKGKFDADLAYSMTRMDTMGMPNFYLGMIERERQPYVDAPQDSLQLTLGYSPSEQLRFAATAKHRFNQKRLPALYLEYDYGEERSTTLDLAVQYKPKFLGDTTINFSINNVTDRAYNIYPDSDGGEQPGRTFRLDIESRF